MSTLKPPPWFALAPDGEADDGPEAPRAPVLPVADIDVSELEVQNLHFTIVQSLTNIWAVMPVVAFMVAPIWSQAGPLRCLVWSAAMLAFYGARALLLAPGRSLAVLRASPYAWRLRNDTSAVACGLMAGSGPAFFFPFIDDPSRMYLSMLFCCWIAGAMASLGSRRGLFGIYTLCFVGGVWLGWVEVRSAMLWQLSFQLALFGLLIHGFTRGFSKQVNESIRIRFRNEKLVAELTVARESAEQANLAKSRFLAVASHDLRQPLHAVTLLNGLLARPQPRDRITEISQQMSRALTSLEKLFSSLLDFSKLEAHKITPAPQWVDLRSLLNRLSPEYGGQAASKGLALDVVDMPFALYVDPQLFERIVRNLLDNALKFTASGDVRLTLSAAVNGMDGMRLSVSDSGPGIPANLRHEIFKEYFQTGLASAKTGLGLGLAIVRRLADLSGLTIEVRDAVGGGACFDVGIPSHLIRPCTMGGEGTEQRVDSADLSSLFVLVIDDDAFARDAVRLLLVDWGCRVLTADSLAQALQLMEKQACPDVILSDFSMGDGPNGVQAIEALRERFGPVSGAILTGEASVKELQRQGEIEYPVLQKPVLAEDLRALLEVFKGLG